MLSQSMKKLPRSPTPCSCLEEILRLMANLSVSGVISALAVACMLLLQSCKSASAFKLSTTHTSPHDQGSATALHQINVSAVRWRASNDISIDVSPETFRYSIVRRGPCAGSGRWRLLVFVRQ